jgi:hypothetical protein
MIFCVGADVQHIALIDMQTAVQFDDHPRNARGWNTTSVSLGNNFALPLLMAGMEGRGDAWLECLQSTGALLKHRVCKRDRPIRAEEKGAKDRKTFYGKKFDDSRSADANVDASTIKFPLTRTAGVQLLCLPWAVRRSPV